MKKLLSLILSITLIASMFICAIPSLAFETLVANEALLNGMPQKDELTFSQNGITASIAKTSGEGTFVWNEDSSIAYTAAGKSSVIIDINANLSADAIENATYDYVEYKYLVSYIGAPTLNYDIRAFNVAGTQISPERYGYTIAPDKYNTHKYNTVDGRIDMDVTGVRKDEIKISVNLKEKKITAYANNAILSLVNNLDCSLDGGLGKIRLAWEGEGTSIVLHDLSFNTSSTSYYDHKVLMSGIENFDGTAVNGVSFADNNNGTVTKTEDGKVTISGLNSAYTRLMFVNETPIVNGTTYPNGGKIYYEQTVSFSAIPSTFSLAFKDSDDRYESARPSLITSTNYGEGSVQCWDVGEGDRFQYIQIEPNTPYSIGVLYDLNTGNYQAYVNGKGANTCKGTWSPDGDYYNDLKRVWLEVKLPADSDTITISDLFVMRVEPSNYNLKTGKYDTNTDVLFSGISHVPGCYKWSDNGFLYQTIGNATLSKDNLCNIKATANAKGGYARMRIDAPVNETTYPDGIAVWEWDFEIESENATEPHDIEFNNGSQGGIAVYEKTVLPGKHKAEFIYNPKTGEYRYYIDGAASEVRSVSKETGINTLYMEWQGNAAGDACILENVKFSNVKDFAEQALSYGQITISEENVASFPITAPKYSFVNPAKLRFIISAYSNDETRLTAINCETKAVPQGENTIILSLNDLNGGTTVKAFLWNDLLPLLAN